MGPLAQVRSVEVRAAAAAKKCQWDPGHFLFCVCVGAININDTVIIIVIFFYYDEDDDDGDDDGDDDDDDCY